MALIYMKAYYVSKVTSYIYNLRLLNFQNYYFKKSYYANTHTHTQKSDKIF